MDFNDFNSRAIADEARPMRVKHPASGELMNNEDGTPCLVLVYGVEGAIAQAAHKEAAKLPKLEDDASIEEWHERLSVTAEKLISGFSGINNGSKPATKSDARWFLNLQMANPLDRGMGRSFVEQVLAFAGSRANYLGKFDAALSEPRTNSAGKAQRQTGGTKRGGKP